MFMDTQYRDEPSPADDLLAAGRALQPEERLMVEVLALACADLRLRARGVEAEALRAAAHAWVANEAEHWPLSFVRICRHFDIEPTALRDRLLAADGRCDGRQPQAA